MSTVLKMKFGWLDFVAELFSCLVRDDQDKLKSG